MNPAQKEKQRRRESVRREVHAYLANRSVVAMSAESITIALKRNFKFSLEEVEAALAFKVDQGAISELPDPNGATPYYKITAAGMLAHERTKPTK